MRLKAMILGLVCGFAVWSPTQAKEILIFGHLYTEASLQQQALLEADEELAQRSGNQIRLEIKPRGQAGDQDSRLIEAVNFGPADMTFVGAPFVARDYAPIGILSSPFGFRDFAHWQHFRTSPLARELADEYEKARSGLIVLGYYYNGVRYLNSKAPIRRSEDLAGLRVRVPNAPIYLQLFRALGATPVPWPYLQTYEALKQGTVDAEENPLTTIEDGKFYEVAPYITLTGHMTDTGVILVNAKRMESLPEDQQKLIRDVFDKLAVRLSERIHAKEVKNMEKLKALGVTFLPIDRAALIAKVEPMVTGTSFAWSGELYDRLQKIP